MFVESDANLESRALKLLAPSFNVNAPASRLRIITPVAETPTVPVRT